MARHMQPLLAFALTLLWTASLALAQGPLPSAGTPAKKDASTERTIAAETSVDMDRAISRRLAEIFAEIKGAEGHPCRCPFGRRCVVG